MNIEDTKKALEITVKPYIAISVAKQVDNSPMQSKFGGFPYLPQGFEYPKTARGNYLYLLAQINFAEVPKLEGFPEKGILQFYIANDDVYGINFEDQFVQEGFRVLYFADPVTENLLADFSFLPLTDFRFTQINDDDFLPFNLDISEECLALSFDKQAAPISHGDYKFDDFADKEFRDFISDNEDIYDEYSGSGHKIGGYPWFMQSDPREFLTEQKEPYILLLQIDSDEYFMWGDGGVGNFFIKESDLRNLGFSNVMYNWDCC
jgi:uncharacterized protein YwqG